MPSRLLDRKPLGRAEKGLAGGQYTPLSPEALKKVHEASLQILESTGVLVEEAEAQDVLRQAGATVDADGVVKIPRSAVEEAVQRAPSKVVLCGREEKHDLTLEEKRVYLGTGGAALLVVDLETGEARPAALRDVALLARLVDALDNIHFYLRPVEPQDVPNDKLDVNKYYAALSNTSKHVMGSCYTITSLDQVVRMGSLVAGGEQQLIDRPFISFITSWMISPLRFATETTKVLAAIVKRGLPVVLSNCPMAGSTSPVTLAGTLAQVNAEQLAGIVFTQSIRPGAPVLYGAVPSVANMATGGYIGGAVEMGLLNAAAAQLAQFYGVPIYNTAGLTDAKITDVQAGAEKAFNVAQVALAGSNFIHHAAGMLESMRAVAYEQYVVDDDILGMAMRAVRGIRVDDEALALEVIDRVGPGGHFLEDEHTLRHARSEFFFPRAASRRTRERWEEEGCKDARQVARERAQQILREHRPLPLPPDVEKTIRAEFDILL